MRWYDSVAVKSSLVAFVATHIPLLGLIALILFWPGLLSPWGVFVVALILTLVATAFVVTVLWRMFRPLRQAADGLKGFMTSGTLFRGPVSGSDEIGRLVGVLVRSLAHLDRSRGALLHSSSITLGEALSERGWAGADGRQWLVLVEADRQGILDGRMTLEGMLELHNAVERALDKLLQAGELAVPWGRGRFLCLLGGSNADVVERMDVFCRHIDIDGHDSVTATAAIEPEGVDAQARAASLQRLEHKLFGLRSQGQAAAVA